MGHYAVGKMKALKRKVPWNKAVAACLATVAVALLLYAIMTGSETTTTDTDRMGMWSNKTYSSSNLALIVLASFIFAVAVMFILLKENYKPLPPEMVKAVPLPAPPPPEERAETKAVEVKVAPEEPAPARTGDEATKDNYLVLRLLSGDERQMFKAVMDSGGEALQKDLIQRTKMSNAKVSRLLDKLEEKGVITKERHGSTNKVRIKLEE